ncbi:MAG TPA: hypothetical protein VF690_14400 [Hymenobacter sp.]
MDAGLGEDSAATCLPGRGCGAEAAGFRTTFSAGFFGGGAGATAAGLAGAGCGARAHQRAPSTPKATPPSTASTHDQSEDDLAGSDAGAGTETIGSSRVVSGPDWAAASCWLLAASTSTSTQRLAQLANRLRVMKHLG